MKEQFVHRFIPNSAPETKQRMLDTLGVKDVDEFFEEIPENVRFNGVLNIPQEPVSEWEVEQRIKKMLNKSKGTDQLISFLGAGCFNHYVPAVCDVINNRSEFLTAYSGSEYVDLGRQQALFETASMLGEMLDMDVVGAPVYDGMSATGDAMMMAYHCTGRSKVLIPKYINSERRDTIGVYSTGWLNVEEVACAPLTGQMDIEDLKKKMREDVACVYIDNPSYLGVIQENCQQIADIAHEAGAVFIVGVDPISLGLLLPPGKYGADIAVLDAQCLGMHQQFGGGQVGFIACRDDKKLIDVMPCWLYSVTKTCVEGELGFSWHALYDRMFYVVRDEAQNFTGTSAGLWGITAGVYLSLMGAYGLEQVDTTILYNVEYLKGLLREIKGVNPDKFTASTFKEFAVDFTGSGKSVAQINKELLKYGILGGKDISEEIPSLGNTALYCVTEVHTKEQLDALAAALKEVLA